MLTLSITYERVTPESAEHGEAEERGYLSSQCGLHLPIDDVMQLGEADRAAATERTMRAHEALREIRESHCGYSATWYGDSVAFYSSEPQEHHYSDGSTVENTVFVRGDKRLLRALIRAVKPTHVWG